jgi:hypothetical protein
MKNMEVQVNGDELVIKIDKAETVGPSSSGKTMLVATSGGNLRVAQNLYLVLNLFRYVQDGSNGDGNGKRKQITTQNASSSYWGAFGRLICNSR